MYNKFLLTVFVFGFLGLGYKLVTEDQTIHFTEQDCSMLPVTKEQQICQSVDYADKTNEFFIKKFNINCEKIL